MIKTGVKSIEPSDFAEVQEEVEQLNWVTRELRSRVPSARMDACDTIGHPMKMWEWARALHIIKQLSVKDELDILSIGAAYDLLSPALCYINDLYDVTECEPDFDCKIERGKLNSFLAPFNLNPIEWLPNGYGTLHELKRKFDVVLSISVIEHVHPDLEKTAWKEMCDLLTPAGVLIVTTDCMPKAQKGYVADDARWTNYSMGTIEDRVNEMKSYGMRPIGSEDYTWHGAHVNDYSFAFIAMEKIA